MIALLLSLLALLLTVAVVCAVGVAITVVPFVAAVDMAERRGFSPLRWGALSVLGVVLAAFLAYLASAYTLWLMLPMAALAWAVPGALVVLTPEDRAAAGPVGAHE